MFFTRKERRTILLLLLIAVIATVAVTYYCCKDEKDEMFIVININIKTRGERVDEKINTEGRTYSNEVRESVDLSHLDPTLK